MSLYRDRLRRAGFQHVLTFEMIDEGGHSLYLFFGTSSSVAIEKFKDGLWEVDTVSGQRFRDPRDPDQLSFDMSAPDFTVLENSFLRLIEERGVQDLETLSDFALLESIYKKTHAKSAVDRLVERYRLVQIQTGQAYSERVYALAPASLF